MITTRRLKLKPDYAEAYNNRGYSYYYGSKANLDEAIADYSKAIELRPDYAYAYNNRGAAYLANGFPDKAISDLNRALQLKPGFPQAHSNRGNAYLRTGPNLPGSPGFLRGKDYIAILDRYPDRDPSRHLHFYNRIDFPAPTRIAGLTGEVAAWSIFSRGCEIILNVTLSD